MRKIIFLLILVGMSAGFVAGQSSCSKDFAQLIKGMSDYAGNKSASYCKMQIITNYRENVPVQTATVEYYSKGELAVQEFGNMTFAFDKTDFFIIDHDNRSISRMALKEGNETIPDVDIYKIYLSILDSSKTVQCNTINNETVYTCSLNSDYPYKKFIFHVNNDANYIQQTKAVLFDEYEVSSVISTVVEYSENYELFNFSSAKSFVFKNGKLRLDFSGYEYYDDRKDDDDFF